MQEQQRNEHTITIEPSGRRFGAGADESILDAALRHGIAFPYGCRNGFCGACRGRLVSGKVTYPEGAPGILTEEESARGVALMCKAHAASDVTVEVREVGDGKELPVKTLPTRVARMERLAPEVMGLWLKLPESERLQFLPGQYIDILIGEGRKRAFSLANAPHEDSLLELHIAQIEGGRFTGTVFEGLHEKDVLRIEGPKGGFSLDEASDRPILLLAGGTGLAPIRSMLVHLIAEECRRPVFLYRGTREARGLYLEAWLCEQAARQDNLQYVSVLSRPDGQWTGRRGYVQDAVLADFPDPSGFDVYCAGPPVMVKGVHDALIAAGLDRAHFFSDPFEFAKD